MAKDFEGLTMIKQHRLVNTVAKDELAKVHAFNVKTYSPAKWAARQMVAQTVCRLARCARRPAERTLTAVFRPCFFARRRRTRGASYETPARITTANILAQASAHVGIARLRFWQLVGIARATRAPVDTQTKP